MIWWHFIWFDLTWVIRLLSYVLWLPRASTSCSEAGGILKSVARVLPYGPWRLLGCGLYSPPLGLRFVVLVGRASGQSGQNPAPITTDGPAGRHHPSQQCSSCVLRRPHTSPLLVGTLYVPISLTWVHPVSKALNGEGAIFCTTL